MTDLRTPGSRAVLIGASTYTSDGLPNVPAIVDTVNDLRAALINQCGMARENIRSLLDPGQAHDVLSQLAEDAQNTQGILVVYYAGHGLAGPHGELYLAVSKTDPLSTRRGFTAISYDEILRALGESPAQAIVVILDCCFSALALTPGGRVDRGLAIPTGREGGGVITSAAREEYAIALADEQYTAFTGELLKLLKDGDPNGHAELTLGDACRYLLGTLEAKKLPRPQLAFAHGADQIVLAANPAYGPRPAGEATADPAIPDSLPETPPQMPSIPPLVPSGTGRRWRFAYRRRRGRSGRTVWNSRTRAGCGGVALIVGLVLIAIPDLPGTPRVHQTANTTITCVKGTLTMVGSTAFEPHAQAAAIAYEDACAREGIHVDILIKAKDSASGISTLQQAAAAKNPAQANLMIAMYDGTDDSATSFMAHAVGVLIYVIVANSKHFHQSSISVSGPGGLEGIFIPPGERGVIAVGRLQGSGSRKALLHGVFGLRNWGNIAVNGSSCPPPSGNTACTEDYTPQVLYWVNKIPNAIGYAGYTWFNDNRSEYPNVYPVNIGSTALVAGALTARVENGSYSFWVVEHLYTTTRRAPLTADFLSFLPNYLAAHPKDGFIACPKVPKSLRTDCPS